MDLNDLDKMSGATISRYDVLSRTPSMLDEMAKSAMALTSIYDNIRRTEEAMAAAVRSVMPPVGLMRIMEPMQSLAAGLSNTISSLNPGLSTIYEGFGATHRQIGLDALYTLNSRFLDDSVGLAAIIEAQSAPWAQTASTLSGVLTSYHAASLEGISALHRTFQSWQTTFEWADAMRGYAHWEPPSLAHFGPLCRYLAIKSWLVSCDVLLELDLDSYNLHKPADREEIMARLCHYYRLHLDEIESEIATNYPKHRRQIASAFAAHRPGDFAGSIPVMFTVAEAIADNIWQASFFCFRRHRKVIVNRLGPRPHRTERPWLLPLYECGGLRKHSERLRPTDRTLNRHAVEHGLRGDLDTEPNALRCVALLDYLHSLAADFQPTP